MPGGSGPTGAVTLVFTDVEASTHLWETKTDAMRDALAVHNELMRRLLAERGGYEVKTEGDAFMVAFAEPIAAVRWCLDAQSALLDADWPAALLDDDACREQVTESGQVIARGLRVRMGVHAGEPDVQTDPTTGRSDYFGPMVNRAARVGGVARGGQVLVSRATWERAAPHLDDAVCVDLGRHRLKGLVRDEHLVQVLPARLAARTFGPVETASARTNLPSPAPRFIGRGADLDRLAAAFAGGVRLVTVVGPGGFGKSSLARRHGYRTLDASASSSVWFVDLTAARSELDVCNGIAKVLDLPLGAGDEVDGVARIIGARGAALVVLDNFEQLVGVATDAVRRWLAACREVRFVVTSREALRVPEETVIEIGALDDIEACDLFLAAARDAAADWHPDSGARDTAAAIARKLEGIPLAIELAASRIAVLAPEQILDRLTERLELLREVGGHGRTLRGALDWSWELLSEAERSVLAQCAVFRGSWSLAAAEAIVRIEGAVRDVLDALQSLRTKSLLRTARVDGRVRFSMYETVREYAAERLAEIADAPAVALRHARYYGTWSEQTLVDLRGPASLRALRELVDEYDNARAAFERVASLPAPSAAEVTDAVKVAACAVVVLGHRGALREQRRLACTAFELGRRSGVNGGHLGSLVGHAWAGWVTGDVGESRECLEAAIRCAESSQDATAELLVLIAHAILVREVDGPSAAAGLWRRASEVAERLDGAWPSAVVLMNEGLRLMLLGDVERARELFARSVQLFAETGDVRYLVMARINTAANLLRAGDPQQALDYLEPALADAAAIGDLLIETVVLENIGEAQTELGLDEARTTLERAAEGMAVVGDPQVAEFVALDYIKLCHDRGQVAEARARLDRLLRRGAGADRRRKHGLGLLRLGLLLACENELADARLELSQATASLRESGDRASRAMAEVVLAVVHARLGEIERVDALLDGAERTLSERMPRLRPLVELARAEVHLQRGDVAAARAAVAGSAELARISTIARALRRSLEARLPD